MYYIFPFLYIERKRSHRPFCRSSSSIRYRIYVTIIFSLCRSDVLKWLKVQGYNHCFYKK